MRGERRDFFQYFASEENRLADLLAVDFQIAVAAAGKVVGLLCVVLFKLHGLVSDSPRGGKKGVYFFRLRCKNN